MKKWYSIGLLLLVLVLAASLMVACGSKDETATTADDTATTVADDTATTVADATATTVAGATDEKIMPTTLGTELGLYGEDQGSSVVKVTDVPAPGLTFPIASSGDFAMKIEAIGADGTVLGTIETADGLVNYAAYADTAEKLLFTTIDGTKWVYLIP
jgi:hypothetical protein